MNTGTQKNAPQISALSRPVTLIGLMGAGKTTIGKLLAKRLSVPFIDSDDEIVRREGMSVADIFAKKGEAYFRQVERESIQDLLEQGNMVLATGGGAMTIPETADMIAQKSLCLWLDSPIGVLADRTKGSDRPLLKEGNPADILGSLYERRKDSYAKAHIRILNDGNDPSEIVEKILEQLKTVK